MAHVVLQVVNGASAGQRIQIRQGQVARIGRTEWSDFCVTGDPQLAEVHFALESDVRGWKVRDLCGQGVQINRVPSTEGAVKGGDRILAGTTEFSVTMLGESQSGGNVSAGAASSTAQGSAADAKAPTGPLAATIAERVELDPAARELLTPEQSPATYLARLKAENMWLDAVRFLAMWLAKREAVRWGCRCHEQYPPTAPLEQQILAATQQWVEAPDDDRRRAAMDLARKNEYKSSASWLASSAFWSQGSILDRELPAVAADEGLTGRTVAVVLMAIAFKTNPAQPEVLWQNFLTIGEPLLNASA